MLLYICPECGNWQDMSFLEIIKQALAKLAEAMNSQENSAVYPSDKPATGYSCPECQHVLVQVAPTDRLTLRRNAQGEETPQSAKRTLLIFTDYKPGEETHDER